MRTKKNKRGGLNQTETLTQTLTQKLKPQSPTHVWGEGHVLGEEIDNPLYNDPLYDFLSNHTHSIECVILKNFKSVYIKNIKVNDKDSSDYSETINDKNFLILSDKDAMVLCSFDINRNIYIDDVLEYTINLTYDPTKSYSLECPDLFTDELKGGGNYDVLLYKYQDPVVRMACEYMNLLYIIFYKPNFERTPTSKMRQYSIDLIYQRLESYKKLIEKYNLSHYKYNYRYPTSSFWNFVREILMNETKTLHPITEKSRKVGVEGEICIFGEGLTNCCEETINYFKFHEGYNTENLFDTSLFNDLKGDLDYKNYTDMSDHSDFKDLFVSPQKFIKREDKELSKFIEICQEVINIIIISSGRAEGGSTRSSGNPLYSADAYNESYPPISVLEVLDRINKADVSTYNWIIRSERFHLSKSPCVHLGLQGSGITDRLTSFFCLEPSYESNVILHSIGHTLDRLYCGHAGINTKGGTKLPNDVILGQILACFEIFLQNIKKSSSDDKNLQKLHIENLDVISLFLISINDEINLTSYLKGKLDHVYKDVENKVTNLFDVNFSFTIDHDNYTINDKCLKIKKKYGCSQKLTRIKKEDFIDTLVPDHLLGGKRKTKKQRICKKK
jgi:hypothetical protein